MKNFFAFLALGLLATAPVSASNAASYAAWSFSEDFTHGIPGWVSYPLAQDQGYDPSIYTSVVAGKPSLVRDVIEEGQRTLQVGMQQPLAFRITPQSVIHLRYSLELGGVAGPVTLTVGATSGERYVFTLPTTAGEHVVAITGAQLRVPAAGANAETLVLEALAKGSLRGAHNRVIVSEVKIDAERPTAVAIASPTLAGRADADTEVADTVVHAIDGRLHLQLKDTNTGAEIHLFDGSGKSIVGGNIDGESVSLGTNPTPGLWRAQIKPGAAENDFRFLVMGDVPAHPRVMLTKERLEQLRTEMPSDALANTIHTQAVALAAQMTYNAKAGDSIELLPKESLLTGLTIYSRLLDLYGNAVVMNALDYRLRNSPQSLDAAKRALLVVAQWPTWTPPWFAAHGLHTYYQTGIFSQRLAFGYDLIADELTPQEKEKIATAFYEKSIAPTIQEYYENERMPLFSSNHEAHSVGGAIGLCAAVYGDVPEWDAKFAPAMGKLVVLYEGLLHGLFPGDGSEAEPAGYQDFAMEGMSMGAAALYQMGIHPKGMDDMMQSYWWPHYAEYKPGYVLDTGDFSGPLLARSGFAWMVEQSDDATLRAFYDADGVRNLEHFFAQKTTTRSSPDIYDLTCCTRPAAAVPTVAASKLFPLRGSAALRSGWQDGATVISLRVGPWFNHQHADEGSFQLAAHGEVLIGEAGYSDYYNDLHYQDYFTQAEGHNTVLVDGDAFSHAGYESDAWKSFSRHPVMTQFLLGGGVDYLSADMTAAYQGTLKNYTREYLFLKPGLLVVHDAIRADVPHSYSFLLHVPVGAEATVQGASATIVQPKASAFVLAAESDAAWKLQATPVPIHDYIDFDKTPVEPRSMMRLDTAKQRDAEFTVGMNVGAAGSLQKMATANAEGISGDSGTTFALFRTKSGDLAAGNLTTDGDVLAKSSECIFVSKAHWLRVDGKTMFSSTATVDAESAGGKLNIYAAGKTTVSVGVTGTPRSVMVDGKSVMVSLAKGAILLSMEAGEHSVEISY